MVFFFFFYLKSIKHCSHIHSYFDKGGIYVVHKTSLTLPLPLTEVTVPSQERGSYVCVVGYQFCFASTIFLFEFLELF